MINEKVKCSEFTTLLNKVLLMQKEGDDIVHVFKDGLHIGEIEQKDLAPIDDLLGVAKRKIKEDESYLYKLEFNR